MLDIETCNNECRFSSAEINFLQTYYGKSIEKSSPLVQALIMWQFRCWGMNIKIEILNRKCLGKTHSLCQSVKKWWRISSFSRLIIVKVATRHSIHAKSMIPFLITSLRLRLPAMAKRRKKSRDHCRLEMEYLELASRENRTVVPWKESNYKYRTRIATFSNSILNNLVFKHLLFWNQYWNWLGMLIDDWFRICSEVNLPKVIETPLEYLGTKSRWRMPTHLLSNRLWELAEPYSSSHTSDWCLLVGWSKWLWHRGMLQ